MPVVSDSKPQIASSLVIHDCRRICWQTCGRCGEKKRFSTCSVYDNLAEHDAFCAFGQHLAVREYPAIRIAPMNSTCYVW